MPNSFDHADFATSYHAYNDEANEDKPAIQSLNQHLLVNSITLEDPTIDVSANQSTDRSANGLYIESSTFPRSVVIYESRTLVKLSLPIALGQLARLGMDLTDLAFIGHLDTQSLVAASSAYVWIGATTSVFTQAVTTVVGTLCSQAVGANNKRLASLWLQLSIVGNFVSFFPLALCWWFTAPVLMLIGVEESTAKLGAKFAHMMIASALPRMLFSSLSAFFQAQSSVLPALLVSSIMLFVNIGLNYMLIFGVGSSKGLGFLGSPLATAITSALLLLIYWIVMFPVLKQNEYWCGWEIHNAIKWSRVKVMLSQFWQVAIGIAVEEFQFQTINIFAANMQPVDLAVMSSVLSIFLVLTSTMYGLTSASTVRIGHYLGEGRPFLAKKVATLSFYGSVGVGLMTGILFLALRDYVGLIYSNDEEIRHLTSRVCLLIGPSFVLMSIFYTSNAILDAQARPGMLAVAFLIGGWAVSVPLAWVFGFHLNLGLMGLWYALTVGYFVVICICGPVAYKSDWPKYSEEARQRSETNQNIPQVANDLLLVDEAEDSNL